MSGNSGCGQMIEYIQGTFVCFGPTQWDGEEEPTGIAVC